MIPSDAQRLTDFSGRASLSRQEQLEALNILQRATAPIEEAYAEVLARGRNAQMDLMNQHGKTVEAMMPHLMNPQLLAVRAAQMIPHLNRMGGQFRASLVDFDTILDFETVIKAFRPLPELRNTLNTIQRADVLRTNHPHFDEDMKAYTLLKTQQDAACEHFCSTRDQFISITDSPVGRQVVGLRIMYPDAFRRHIKNIGQRPSLGRSLLFMCKAAISDGFERHLYRLRKEHGGFDDTVLNYAQATVASQTADDAYSACRERTAVYDHCQQYETMTQQVSPEKIADKLKPLLTIYPATAAAIANNAGLPEVAATTSQVVDQLTYLNHADRFFSVSRKNLGDPAILSDICNRASSSEDQSPLPYPTPADCGLLQRAIGETERLSAINIGRFNARQPLEKQPPALWVLPPEGGSLVNERKMSIGSSVSVESDEWNHAGSESWKRKEAERRERETADMEEAARLRKLELAARLGYTSGISWSHSRSRGRGKGRRLCIGMER